MDTATHLGIGTEAIGAAGTGEGHRLFSMAHSYGARGLRRCLRHLYGQSVVIGLPIARQLLRMATSAAAPYSALRPDGPATVHPLCFLLQQKRKRPNSRPAACRIKL